MSDFTPTSVPGHTAAPGSCRAWLVIILAVFIVRVIPWAMAEFWYDEVLTLHEFALDPMERGLWKGVFRTYPIANNHILSTAVYWGWLNVLNKSLFDEHLVRLPSIIWGMGSLALVLCHWRKWLGEKAAILGAAALAISPVFTAFAYQVRGYSLSVFLVTLAISGLLEAAFGSLRYGIPLLLASSVLLPLVIPSNALVVPVLALPFYFTDRPLRQRLVLAAATLFSGALGASYYLTIWSQFLRASREPAGWPSPLMVGANLLLALVAHAFVLLLVLVFRRPPEAQAQPEACRPIRRWSAAIAVGSALVIAAALVFSRSGHAPYPRVFLSFLPLASLAILLPLARRNLDKAFNLLLVAVLANGLAWERISTALTDIEISQGRSPSNLLQQYYRGAVGLRQASSIMQDEEWLENSIILTDEYDFPTMRCYCWLYGKAKRYQVVTINTAPRGFFNDIPLEQRPRIWAVAKTPQAAAHLFEHAGISTEAQLMDAFGKEGGMQQLVFSNQRGIYVPPMPKPPRPRKYRPGHPLAQPKQTLI